MAASPSAEILVPHRPDSFSEPVSLAELKRAKPLTFHYFRTFEKELRARSGYKQLHHDRPEFYVVGNVGDYTIAPYKVVFKELTEVFQCAVIGPTPLETSRTRKPIIPDHKLLFLTCHHAEEAHFLAGVLNSIPVRVALYSASVGVQTQSYYATDISRLQIPAFNGNEEIHIEIARISEQCHELAANSAESVELRELEARLSATVATIWKISKRELTVLDGYYREILTYRGKSALADQQQVEG